MEHNFSGPSPYTSQPKHLGVIVSELQDAIRARDTGTFNSLLRRNSFYELGAWLKMLEPLDRAWANQNYEGDIVDP